ncbi:MAG TPA: protein kinase [Vicinamibacteria bacterium]|nr:protein kinase [Vicinamibacteria bacterium]
MKLENGSSFGAYRVVGLLGAGGMGEVYRAHDPKLRRDVALKIVPELFAWDEERMKRFEREAHVLASLNHPNIEAIYGLEESGDERALVLELVEGPTLAERIAQGPIPLEESLAIARQMVDALDTAHEKGIVHRDLKPGNVKLTPEGNVKILDFGLAKPLLETTSSSGDASSLSQSPTLMKGTQAGVILGTASYMSPEQARGKQVDKRADLWALGVILYEMLTGARLFDGETISDTLAAVLTRDPDWSRLPKETPAATRRLLSHLLERDPKKRLRDVGDARFDLEPGVSSDVVRTMEPKGTRRRWLLVGLVGVLLATALAYQLGRHAVSQSSMPSFRPLTFRRGTVDTARFAPDGGTVFYSAAWDGRASALFSTRLESPESSALDLPSGWLVGVVPGELAFLSVNQTLARAPLGSGAPREVLTHVQWADWSRDGSSFAVVHAVEGSVRLEFPVGTVVFETATGGILRPSISPSGDRVAFVEALIAGYTRGRVRVVGRDGSIVASSKEYNSFSGLSWRSDREVWFSAQDSGKEFVVFALSLSGEVREVLRTPGSLALHDISPDGRLLVSQFKGRFETVGLAPGDAEERDLTWLDRTYIEDLTPDGRTIVFHEGGIGGEMIARDAQGMAFLRGTDGSPAVRLGMGQPLAISPDGRWAILMSGENARITLYPTGAGSSRDLPAANIRQYYDAWWFPDGRHVLIAANEEDRPRRLFVQDLEGGDPQALTPEGVWTEENSISPDGKWVAAFAPDEPMSLYPVEEGEVRGLPGIAPDEYVLRWSTDGSHVFVSKRRVDGPVVPIFRLDVGTGERALWKELAPRDPSGVTGIAWICLTPDGKSYAYTYGRVLSDLYLVENAR